MDLQQAIEIIKDHLDSSPELYFQYEKTLCNGYFFVQKITNDVYSLEFNTYDYTTGNEQKTVFVPESQNLEEILNLISFMTKEDQIYYCKINDLIYMDKQAYDNRSKLNYASLFVTNLIEECCVCKDHNIVKTSCQHNLCRICFKKCERKMFCISCDSYINYISCPLCRLILKADCSHFF